MCCAAGRVQSQMSYLCNSKLFFRETKIEQYCCFPFFLWKIVFLYNVLKLKIWSNSQNIFLFAFRDFTIRDPRKLRDSDSGINFVNSLQFRDLKNKNKKINTVFGIHEPCISWPPFGTKNHEMRGPRVFIWWKKK